MVSPVAFASIGYKVSLYPSIQCVADSSLQDLRCLLRDQRVHGTLCILFLRMSMLISSSILLTLEQPETAYRSLEEMDEIFQDVHGFKGAFDVVKVAKHKPHRYGKNGELLISYEETETATRRRSSVGSPDGRRVNEKTMSESNGADLVENAGQK